MNPQNSRAFVPKFYGCRVQLIALITLLTSLTISAGARDFRNASERTTWYPLGLIVSPTTLPNGTTSVFYRAYLRARGGAGRYQFSRVGGDMPQGLSLRSNGAITGTPQNAGSFSFRVLVTDLPRRDRCEATISVYIADGSENWNSPISVSVSPLGPTVPSGGTQQFEATVSNTTNTAVAWSSSHGTISSSGMFTAPTVTAVTNVMVRATSMADSTKSAATSVMVTPAPSPVTPIVVSVSPASAHVGAGATQQFSATVSNTSNTAVTWSASDGTISPSGMFTAPSAASSSNVMVTATSVADPSKSAQASVSVDALPAAAVSISINPTSANLTSGGTQQFSATVSNSSNTAVTWSASNGTISQSGMFTAPSVASITNVTVMATSVADPSKTAQASVSINPPAAVTISINPTSATIGSGATQQFSATVSNSSNTAVTWSASNGTISQSGMFTAPSVASTTNVTVMATSVADPSKTAQASVSINPPAAVTISINPTSATIGSGATQQFSATVSNSSNTAVTWSASNGTISQSGMFTAPSVASATNVTVTATSVADSTQSAQATVRVDPPAPTNAVLLGTLNPGQLTLDMETWIGKGNVMTFSDPHVNWNWTGGGYTGTYGVEMSQEWANHHITHIGWGSLWPLPGCTSVNCATQNIDALIANGTYDAGLNSSAQALKQWLSGPDGVYGTSDDYRVYLRPAQEQNGNWFVWSPGVNGNTAADYINAWKHIWNIFMVNNALDSRHVQWIWCPNNEDISSTMESTYPGDQYVDWLAVDGYNGGGDAGKTVNQIFDTALSRLRALNSTKPIGIFEAGADDSSAGSIAVKNAWITSLYNYVPANNIKLVSWFNQNGGPGSQNMVFGCANSGTCPYGGRNSNPTGDGQITINGTLYNFYSAYKTGVLQPQFMASDPTNPRLLTDAQFQGGNVGCAPNCGGNSSWVSVNTPSAATQIHDLPINQNNNH